MANTRDDISLPKGVWTNLYAASGITVGTACTVVNKGVYSFNICISSAAPASPSKGFPIFVGGTASMINVPSGSSGLWAYSADGSTTLLVQE